jgi:hypothetical protein
MRPKLPHCDGTTCNLEPALRAILADADARAKREEGKAARNEALHFRVRSWQDIAFVAGVRSVTRPLRGLIRRLPK